MNVMRRKYNLLEGKGVKRSIKDEMTYLNLPDAVQKVVRDSLQEMGKTDNEQIDSHSLLLEQAEIGAESCDDVLNSESLKDLTEAELCLNFGINPEILQKEFSHLFKSILNCFRHLTHRPITGPKLSQTSYKQSKVAAKSRKICIILL